MNESPQLVLDSVQLNNRRSVRSSSPVKQASSLTNQQQASGRLANDVQQQSDFPGIIKDGVAGANGSLPAGGSHSNPQGMLDKDVYWWWWLVVKESI